MKLTNKKLTKGLTTGLILIALIGLPIPARMQNRVPRQVEIGQRKTPVLQVSTPSAGPPMSRATLSRLDAHRAILNAHGVTNLSALGTLTISGAVVPQPGFVRAAFVRNVTSMDTTVSSARIMSSEVITPSREVGATKAIAPSKGIARPSSTLEAVSSVRSGVQSSALKPSNMTTTPTLVRNARGLSASGVASIITRVGNDISVPAVKIMGEPFVIPVPRGGQPNASKTTATLPIFTAYWVANTINLPNNTTIVIQPNVRYLVLIANTITVGSNVMLTYEDVPVMNPPAVPGKPSAVPGKPSTPNPFTEGYAGSQGYGGTQPPQIGTPPDAPNVELWTLLMNQLPTVILKGQHGYKGVQGGGGGDGGPGGNGSNSEPKLLNCNHGPNNGGVGGKGGRGADGGQGGNGGNGGLWSLYAPTIPSSLTIDVSGGERGEGGDPGVGGNGGPGGSRGAITGYCANLNWSHRHDGAGGPNGDPGLKGGDGVVGNILPNSINQVVIDSSVFTDKLTDPAITHVYPEHPNTATVGSTITIEGLNFANTDTVTVGGVAATTQFFANTMLQAIVPNTWGGAAQVKVVPLTGPASNTGTLYIKPVVLSTVPASPSTNLKPGSTVVANGTGFSQQATVRVNHEDIATVNPASSTTLSFVMARPASVPYNPANSAGEPAILSVAGSGPIIESDSIPIVIDTFQIFVLGDSIAWGEGLQEPDKFHSLVEAYEKTLHPGMSVYKKVSAHTGATLSWNDPISGTAQDGDIPQDYPSIQQQANTLASMPNANNVDLILVTGCANDVGFQNFLDPLATQFSIAPLVAQHCLGDMTAFLHSLASQFPSATIVVTGYYQGLSLDTDPAYFVNLAGVLYGLEGNQGLGPQALATAVGITPAGRIQVVNNAGYFASQANMRLASAVQAANVPLTPDRIFFANPGFGPTNAANASNAWVFGLSGGLIPGPTDSSAALSRRESKCAAIYNQSSFDYMFCRLASTGHPNETGATKYFNAIQPYL